MKFWGLFPLVYTAIGATWKTMTFSIRVFLGSDVMDLLLRLRKAYFDVFQSIRKSVPFTSYTFQTVSGNVLRHTNILIVCKQQVNAGARRCCRNERILSICEGSYIGGSSRSDTDADTPVGHTAGRHNPWARLSRQNCGVLPFLGHQTPSTGCLQ